MRNVLEDLRYAMRVLRRTPTLTAVAVLTLALGIAAITTVFGWIDGMVLHPFRGARDDGQLAVLESVSASGMQHQVSYADSRDFQDSLRSISGLLLNQKGPASIGEGDKPYFAWYAISLWELLRRPGRKAGPGSRVRSRRIRRPGQSGHGRHQLSGVEELFSCRQVRPRPHRADQPVPGHHRGGSASGISRRFPGSGARHLGSNEAGRRTRARCATLRGHSQAQTWRQRLGGKRRGGDGCGSPCPWLSEDQPGDRRPDRTDLEGAGGGVEHRGMADGHSRCGECTRAADCLRQRRQSSTGSFHSPADGVRHPRCPGRQSGSSEPPVDYLKACFGCPGNACRVAAGSMGLKMSSC